MRRVEVKDETRFDGRSSIFGVSQSSVSHRPSQRL